MLEGIEALIVLEHTGTISEAAAQLRLTQSAVSKRIQALQADLGYALIEPDGRRVRLTSHGTAFLEKAKPLIVEIKNLKNLKEDVQLSQFSIAMADSIAASWGPKFLRKVLKKIKNLELDIHVHRSVLIQEYVKLGRYHIGLCTSPVSESDLFSFDVAQEHLVVISNEFKGRPDITKMMVTIEKGSSTWKSVGSEILQHPKLSKYDYLHVESFSAAIQMAHEGFGNALVPLGLAEAHKVPAAAIHILGPQIKRKIHLICRKNISLQSKFIEFKDVLSHELKN